MNERIRELAKQSQLWDSLDPRSLGICDSSTENRWGEELQEFAELIVRECIEVIDNTSDNTKLMRVNLYQKIIWAIEDHFGIEE